MNIIERIFYKHYYTVCIPDGIEAGLIPSILSKDERAKRKYYNNVVSQFKTYLENHNIKYSFHSYICSYFCTNKPINCNDLNLSIHEIKKYERGALPTKNGPPVHQCVMTWFGVPDPMWCEDP